MMCQIHATRRLRTPDLSCRRHRPACSAYRLTGDMHCTYTWRRSGSRTRNPGRRLPISHLEVPVFLSALMYTINN